MIISMPVNGWMTIIKPLNIIQMTFDEFNSEGCTGKGDHTDMLFRSHLYGPDGAFFELLKERHHTDEDVAKAKDWIRYNRDCTGFNILHHTTQPTEWYS